MRRRLVRPQLPLQTPDELKAVLKTHDRLHTAIDLRDIYKLLYQRVFGPEHSIEDTSSAWQYLYLEVLNLPTLPIAVPLLEPLSPVLCRLNLQPFMQQGGSVETLWCLFRDSARQYRPGTLEDLIQAWQLFLRTCWGRRYDPAYLEQFWQQMASADFPPVHHSRLYTAANAPHYRVVLRSLAEQRLNSVRHHVTS